MNRTLIMILICFLILLPKCSFNTKSLENIKCFEDEFFNIYNKEPVDCDEAIEQYEKLKKLRYKLRSKYYEVGFVKSFHDIPEPFNKVEKEYQKNCIKAILLKGDKMFHPDWQDEGCIKPAIEIYREAYFQDTTDSDINFRLAYCYDHLDSVSEAEKYYNKTTESNITFNNFTQDSQTDVDVKEIKHNFFYCDSIKNLFKKYPDKCSITLKLISYHTYLSPWYYRWLYPFDFNSENYVKLKGDGKFSRNYDSLFSGKIPLELLNSIVGIYQDARLLSFYNPFGYKSNLSEISYDNTIPDYLYFEIELETPEFSKEIAVYGLFHPDHQTGEIKFEQRYYCLNSRFFCKMKAIAQIWILLNHENLVKYKDYD
jgi:hypothetical protein